MKIIKTVFIFFIIAFSPIVYANSNTLNFLDIKKQNNSHYSKVPRTKGSGWKKFKRFEYFWGQRTLLDGKFPDTRNILNDLKRFRNAKSDNLLQSSLKSDWKLIGPKNNPVNLINGDDTGVGRINCVRFSPDGTVWAGSASGGLWKSIDSGSTWNVIGFSQFLSIGISDIAISESNPKIIYVATGDADGSYMSNVYSIGVIKSTDGGNSWAITNLAYSIDQNMIISKILVSPVNPNLVYAGTSIGIYTSNDGGLVWYKLLQSDFVFDMKFNTKDPSKIIATSSDGKTSYLQITTNSGANWKTVYTLTGVCRVALATTSLDANYIYAVAADKTSLGLKSVLQSTDAGNSWKVKCTTPNILNIETDGSGTDGQGDYDLAIEVNNYDKKWIYIGGINLWQSKDEGVTFNSISDWQGDYNKPYVHADIHDIRFNPYNDVVFCANDGGITISSDNGKTWTDKNNNLSITEIYKLSTSIQNPNMIYTGNQDNGSFLYNGTNWSVVEGGDGMENAIDPVNSNIGYVSMYYGDFYKTTNGGSNFSSILNSNTTGTDGEWVTPFILNPKNSSTLYAGYDEIWKSDNYGSKKTWYKLTNLKLSELIGVLAVAQSDTNYIYAATPTAVRLSTNGGSKWTTIMTLTNQITAIAVDPANASRAWISCSGYTKTGRIFEWDGKAVKDISYNLPILPVNCILYQKNTSDRLFIGTDVGVFYKESNMNSWNEFNGGLPNIVIFDLDYNYTNNMLRAATFGRGVWETSISTCNIDRTSLKLSGPTTFCQGDTLTIEINNPKYSYKWSTGETSSKIKVSTSGIYYVTSIDSNNCKDVSDVVSVSVFAKNDIIINTNLKHGICPNDSLVLTATLGFAKYYWSNGDSTKKTIIKLPGIYSVRGVSSDNCISDSKPVNILQFSDPQTPKITRSLNTLIASPAAHYQWYLNSNKLINDTNFSLSAKSNGFYKVEITDSNGCRGVSDSIQIILDIKELLNDPNFKISYSDGYVGLEAIIDQLHPFNIEIFNLIGIRLYSSQDFPEQGILRKNINFINEPDGLYIISLQYGQTKIFAKFIK
ncbi:MAG: hypothetical protein NT007_15535 [Candidatus Kapabacteria bacterium]|nr:hypothetical protein [Candidatus Kapabacteria bacterium]